MLSKIYIISGFLGAGKTTFIQKMLKESSKSEKIVLIENDFGEISVDATLLKNFGVEVKEINSGCICCSLTGDFEKALQEVIERFKPSKIIIEPSGVGKLSDIVKACEDPKLNKLAKIDAKITVVDVKRCAAFVNNFGEFFENQIKYADIVFLNRTESYPDKVDEAHKLVANINPFAFVYRKSWEKLRVEDILLSSHSKNIFEHKQVHEFSENNHCCCNHHEHSHSADEIFDTLTLNIDRKFTKDELKGKLARLEHSSFGTILRAKGILSKAEGFLNVQYISGDYDVTDCHVSGSVFCIIGCELNKQKLANLFCEA